jgi:hypothetical protein
MIATRLKELGVRYNGLDKDVRDYDPLPIFSSSNHCLSQGTKLTAIDGDQNQVNRTFTLGIGESVFHENIIPIFETSIYLSINKWSSDYFYAMPNHRSGNFGSSYSEPTEDQIKERLKYGMNEGDYLVEQANAAWVSVVEEDGVMVPYLSLVCQKNGSVIRHVKLDGAIRYAKDYVFGDRLFSGMLFLDKSLHNFYSGIKDEGVGVLIKSSVLSVNKPNSETVNNIIGVQSLVNNY